MSGSASLLLVTHVHVRQGPRGWQVDDQTAAGIAQWCRHFDAVTFVGIGIDDAGDAFSSSVWADLEGVHPGLRVIALPYGYSVGGTWRHWRGVRAVLAREIGAHRHLCFTLGNVVGDWPALGAWEAVRQGRRFAAWIDRVEPFVIRTRFAGAPVKRLLAEATMPFTQGVLRYLLRRSAVALLQGGDTFDWYAGAAGDPHCTYDTHTRADDAIAADVLAAKRARVLAGGPLRIVYTGRAHGMKGPWDWLDVVQGLVARGVPVVARWLGDGPLLDEMRAAVAARGLDGVVALPGYADKAGVMAALAEADLLMFCHKTPESARCLIEALVRGCPIVGYDGGYPRGLVAAEGGGAFVPLGDVAGLVATVAGLHADRAGLAGLIGAAAASGQRYDEDTVYAHRAGLMKLG